MKTASKSTAKAKIQDPTALLRAALAERCERNPQYSIRAFARSSGISHTVLSLVLSGKRRLSKKAALKLAEYLELDATSKQALLRPYSAMVATEYQALSLDAFEVISDWYHYAILSLLELPDFKMDARWIAKQLAIPHLEAKLAIERLQRVGLLAQDEHGKWYQTSAPLKIENSLSTAATRKFHKQLLNRASESIDLNTFEERDFSSMTFAMDPALMSYASEKIKKFRRELTADLEARGTAGAVYNMTVQLFPVTPLPKTELKNELKMESKTQTRKMEKK